MRSLIRFLQIFTVLCLILANSLPSFSKPAVENHCRTSYMTYGHVHSLCKDKTIPIDKTANIRGQQLVCAGSENLEVRMPEDYDFDEWSDLLQIPGDRGHEAFKMRQQSPEPNWKGVTTYDVYETWQWDSCDLITSESRCGFYYKCSYDPFRSNLERKFPGEGIYEQRLSENQQFYGDCDKVSKQCYADVTHTAEDFCSTEDVSYEIVYKRPENGLWNPDSLNYEPVLPNKYDLLPGEVETLNITAHSGYLKRSRLAPNLKIKDPRNEYQIYEGGSAVGARCLQGAGYTLNYTVNTLRRIPGSRTPNTLTLPKTYDGESIEPLVWNSSQNGLSKVEKASLHKLRVQEKAAAMAKLISDKSQDHLGRTNYFKNTKVRIRLVKKRWWWWDEIWSNHMYVSDSAAVKATVNSLSENQEIRLSDLWEIELDGVDFEKNILAKDRKWPLRLIFQDKKFIRHLKPNRRYALKVSVYQKGLKFYKQACEDDPHPDWHCSKLAIWPLNRSENSYFSEELEIPFKTSKDYDGRSSWQKFTGSINLGERFLNWIGESLGFFKD